MIGFYGVRVRIIVFYGTFNNISALSWQSVLLVEKTGVPRENQRPASRYSCFIVKRGVKRELS